MREGRRAWSSSGHLRNNLKKITRITIYALKQTLVSSMVFTKDKASFPGLCLPEERTVGEVRFDPGLALGLYCLDESGCGGRGHVDATESENIDYKNRQS